MITKEQLEDLKLKYKFEACKIIADAESEQRFLIEKENKQLTKFEEKMNECDKKLWALKYHATRIEELDLPYWTDIVDYKDEDIYKIASFRRKNGMLYNLLFKRGDLMLWSVQELMSVWIDLATEENYTKLCDLCLKLFKGEEKC